jgi:hypothetical protein
MERKSKASRNLVREGRTDKEVPSREDKAGIGGE